MRTDTDIRAIRQGEGKFKKSRKDAVNCGVAPIYEISGPFWGIASQSWPEPKMKTMFERRDTFVMDSDLWFCKKYKGMPEYHSPETIALWNSPGWNPPFLDHIHRGSAVRWGIG